jgi:hypothetical protein
MRTLFIILGITLSWCAASTPTVTHGLPVRNIGPTAVDAKWRNFGPYLQRMIDTIQIQWDRTLNEGRIYPPSGSTVTVKFILDAAGHIARIESVETKGSNEQGSQACVNAITKGAPYGQWSEKMRATLGNQQELTFTFYYQ